MSSSREKKTIEFATDCVERNLNVPIAEFSKDALNAAITMVYNNPEMVNLSRASFYQLEVFVNASKHSPSRAEYISRTNTGLSYKALGKQVSKSLEKLYAPCVILPAVKTVNFVDLDGITLETAINWILPIGANTRLIKALGRAGIHNSTQLATYTMAVGHNFYCPGVGAVGTRAILEVFTRDWRIKL